MTQDRTSALTVHPQWGQAGYWPKGQSTANHHDRHTGVSPLRANGIRNLSQPPNGPVVKCHPSGLRGIMGYQNLDFVGLKQELSNNQITVRHGFKI
jgi:hypothetical protein